MPQKLAQGRDMTLDPIAQPGDSTKEAKASYKVNVRVGNNANMNQRHRTGGRKFFDNPTDRPTVSDPNSVPLVPGLRKD